MHLLVYVMQICYFVPVIDILLKRLSLLAHQQWGREGICINPNMHLILIVSIAFLPHNFLWLVFSFLFFWIEAIHVVYSFWLLARSRLYWLINWHWHWHFVVTIWKTLYIRIPKGEQNTTKFPWFYSKTCSEICDMSPGTQNPPEIFCFLREKVGRFKPGLGHWLYWWNKMELSYLFSLIWKIHVMISVVAKYCLELTAFQSDSFWSAFLWLMGGSGVHQNHEWDYDHAFHG